MAALQTGTGVLAHRLVEWLTSAGPVAALRRGFGSAFGLFLVGGIVYAAPVLAVPAVVVFLVAAVRTGREVERQEEAEAGFVQLLADAIGDRNGVLLVDVLLLLHRAGMHTDWRVADVRAQVEALGIRVRDSLKVGGRVSPGVHREDLSRVWDVDFSPPPPVIDIPSPEVVTCENYPTTSGTVRIGEGVVISYPERGPAEDDGGFDDHATLALRVVRGGDGRCSDN